MPATTGFTSIGAQLKLGTGTGPVVYTHIGNTTTFSLEQTADQIDATHLMSDSGYREYKAGYKTATVTFEGHFDPDDAQQAPPDGILGMFESGAPAPFQADFSGADNGGVGAPTTLPICSFAGVVTAFSIAAPTGDMVTYNGTISMSSSPVWGDGVAVMANRFIAEVDAPEFGEGYTIRLDMHGQGILETEFGAFEFAGKIGYGLALLSSTYLLAFLKVSLRGPDGAVVKEMPDVQPPIEPIARKCLDAFALFRYGKTHDEWVAANENEQSKKKTVATSKAMKA